MNRNRLFASAALLPLLFVAAPAFAQDGAAGGDGYKYLAAGLAMGLAAIGATLGQGNAARAALEAGGRNPQAADKLQTQLIISLVFMETVVLFAFVFAFVLNTAF